MRRGQTCREDNCIPRGTRVSRGSRGTPGRRGRVTHTTELLTTPPTAPAKAMPNGESRDLLMVTERLAWGNEGGGGRGEGQEREVSWASRAELRTRVGWSRVLLLLKRVEEQPTELDSNSKRLCRQFLTEDLVRPLQPLLSQVPPQERYIFNPLISPPPLQGK